MLEENPNAITLTRVWIRENIITTVLGIFILLSLIIHALTISALFRVRDVVRLQLTSAASQVAEARQQTLHYDFPIKQNFPFKTAVNISETLDVPINEKFPINQTFNVPIDLNSFIPGAGTYSIPVPINLTVPVSTTIHVPIRRQIPIETTVNVDTTIPIQIDLKQPGVGDLLKRVEDSLRDLLSKL
ncbi:MAG: hypothetical protein H0X37_00565 [Herpetosiphonaceae bacterium]|nr:hypothetical protein [Herpetosiphonaceae bacterium]